MRKKKLCLIILPLLSFVPGFILLAYDAQAAGAYYMFGLAFLVATLLQIFAVKKWMTAVTLGLAKNFGAMIAFLLFLIMPLSPDLVGTQLIICTGINAVLFLMSAASVYFERKVLIP